MKILLAIDELEFSQEAIREVEERFGTSDTSVRVLHVVGTFVPPAAALLDAGLMGSVAQYVVDHAPCSVEIAHRKKAEGHE